MFFSGLDLNSKRGICDPAVLCTVGIADESRPTCFRTADAALAVDHVSSLRRQVRRRAQGQELLAKVGKRIADGRVWELVQRFLKQDIMEDMKRWTPMSGSPQGAVISPLLANIYLHELDVEMREAGLVMVRYADDVRHITWR